MESWLISIVALLHSTIKASWLKIRAFGGAMREFITQDEFYQFVVPHVRLLGWWPEGYGDDTDDRISALIWDTIHSENYTDWKLQSALFDTFGPLNFDAKYTAHAVSSALNAYQTFKHALNHGASHLRIIRDRHTCNWSLPDNISVDDMAEDYENPEPSSMLIPLPLCPHNSSEGGGLCTCSLLHDVRPRQRQEDDPKLAGYLESLWKSAS